jgi:hypothetical protein
VPLFDHFHAPLRKRRHWESFPSSWTTFIARQLNKKPLPAGFIAEPHVTLGVMVEADVATFDEEATETDPGARIVPAEVWVPPRPSIVSAVDLGGLDVCEVRVYDDDMARTLVAAVEVVSPANKDRASHRRAFVAKCAAYLQQDVSVIIVDVVTSRRYNLYAELADFLEVSKGTTRQAIRSHVYAVACRAVPGRKRTQLQVWPAALRIGQPLPVLPLWLTREVAVPLDLESSYLFTCDSLSIPA